MSINAIAAGAEAKSTDALRRFASMPAMSGIGNPRMAPKTLALVIALHVGILGALANYRTEVTPPAPPVMVTLITPEPAPEPPKPEVTPPKPLPAAPRPVKKAEPKPEKKPAPKPAIQPEPQLISKAPEPVAAPPAEPPAPVQEPEPETTEAPQPQQVAPPPAPPAPAEEPQVEPPNFNADYLDNPAPAYPTISRRLGEQGRVLLRVQVAPAGTARNVVLHKSSGFDRLDRIALETVRKWKFVPARQGDKPVEAWVIVPIQFNLKG